MEPYLKPSFAMVPTRPDARFLSLNSGFNSRQLKVLLAVVGVALFVVVPPADPSPPLGTVSVGDGDDLDDDPWSPEYISTEKFILSMTELSLRSGTLARHESGHRSY